MANKSIMIAALVAVALVAGCTGLSTRASVFGADGKQLTTADGQPITVDIPGKFKHPNVKVVVSDGEAAAPAAAAPAAAAPRAVDDTSAPAPAAAPSHDGAAPAAAAPASAAAAPATPPNLFLPAGRLFVRQERQSDGSWRIRTNSEAATIEGWGCANHVRQTLFTRSTRVADGQATVDLSAAEAATICRFTFKNAAGKYLFLHSLSYKGSDYSGGLHITEEFSPEGASEGHAYCRDIDPTTCDALQHEASHRAAPGGH